MTAIMFILFAVWLSGGSKARKRYFPLRASNVQETPRERR